MIKSLWSFKMHQKVIKISNHMKIGQYVLLLLIGLLFIQFYFYEYRNSSLHTNVLGCDFIVMWLFAIIYFREHRKSDCKNDIDKITFLDDHLIISYLGDRPTSFLYTDVKKCTFVLDVSGQNIGRWDDSKTNLTFTILLNNGKTYKKVQKINDGFFRKSYACAIDVLKCKSFFPNVNIDVLAEGKNEIALKKIEHYRLFQEKYLTKSEKMLVILGGILFLILLFAMYDIFINNY